MTAMRALLLALALCAAPTAAFVRAPAAAASATALRAETLKIGIFGGGTVGGGIVEILSNRQDALVAATGGVGLEVAAVVVRDASKERDWALPPGCKVTESFDDVLDDDSIGLVVEVMGGTTLAKDVVFKALRAGKDVVTANKALIAAALTEIEAVVDEVNAGGAAPVNFGYEAAVCGGIPIIHALQNDFVGDDVTRLRGIMNGCTNFMLTKMEAEGLSYGDCLDEASALGYAEEDPTLDVGGFDARSKLAILIRLAFGVDVDEERIAIRGIEALETVDFEYAREQLGGTIKLLGFAEKAGGVLTAYVMPCFVPKEATLATIGDATNAVEVASANLGASVLVGKGAGRFPTANSCVSDVVACARQTLAKPFAKKVDGVAFDPDFSSRFYVRIKYANENGIVKAIGDICAKHDVGIYSLLQKPGSDYFVLITEQDPYSDVKQIAKDIEAETWSIGDVFTMPVAEV